MGTDFRRAERTNDFDVVLLSLLLDCLVKILVIDGGYCRYLCLWIVFSFIRWLRGLYDVVCPVLLACLFDVIILELDRKAWGVVRLVDRRTGATINQHKYASRVMVSF
jgi:hypothetical protein